MASSITSPDLGHVSDDTSLLHHSLNSHYAPYSPYQDSPGSAFEQYHQIPTTEAYSFLDSGLKPPARENLRPESGHGDHLGLRASFNGSLQPSLSSKDNCSYELRERLSRPDKRPSGEVLEINEQAKPTTLSSSKGYSDIIISVMFLILCFPFCFVFVYALYLNDKPIDGEHWDIIQFLLRLVYT